MCRVFAIVLVCLLPLQFSWAVAAPYCGHEAVAAQARHLGHHEHQHLADAPADGEHGAAAKQAAGAIDADCGQCHGTGAGLPVPAVAVCCDSRVAHLCDAVDEATRVGATSPPERPQWVRLA